MRKQTYLLLFFKAFVEGGRERLNGWVRTAHDEACSCRQ